MTTKYNILITGVAGFLGSHVCDALLEKGFSVIGVDDLSGGFLQNLDPRVDFVNCDIANSDNIKELWKSKGPFRVVYHLAAYAAEGLSHFIRRFNYNNNLIGSINLINESVKSEVCECFVFTSSIAAYGEQEPPLLETTIPVPADPYGIAKYAVELDLKSAHEMWGLNSIIFRPHNVYGERQHVEKFIPNTIRKIIRNEELIIHTDSNMIPGSRFYIHNEDLAESIVFLLKNKNTVINEAFKIQNKEPAKVNISGESLISNLEVAELVSNELEEEFTYKLLDKDPQRPGHDIKYGLDDSFLRSIGGSFDREFKFGIKSTVKWFTDNKSWINL